VTVNGRHWQKPNITKAPSQEADHVRRVEAYTRQGVYGPTIPPYEVYNPARAEVSTEHVFAVAMNDVINNGMTPEQAIDKAFKRAEAIFAKYPIAQS
jgi:ABC-type glycerol-3-phosphate transport system substrate-binding protein